MVRNYGPDHAKKAVESLMESHEKEREHSIFPIHPRGYPGASSRQAKFSANCKREKEATANKIKAAKEDHAKLNTDQK